jgi:hypothetical protein
MTLSILMYGMMGCLLAALVAILVVEAVGSPVKASRRPRRAAPDCRRQRGRVRQDGDCPRRVAGSSPAARAAAPSRRRATPSSCRRWLA